MAGNLMGPQQAGLHLGDGLVDTARFVGKVINPFDDLISPPGQSARDQVGAGIGRLVDYGGRVAANPHKLVDDARQAGHQVNVALNPLATPQADTLAGEFGRTYKIGANEGELAANIALFGLGGDVAATSKTLRGISKLRPTEYLKASNPDVAMYLDKPYEGMGHHSIISRKTARDLFGDTKFARTIVDHPLNVVTFRGLTKGEGYGVHAAIDSSATGFGVAKNLSAKGWSARKAGIETQRGLERIWNGTPEAMKATVAGAGGGAYGLEQDAFGKADAW